MYEYFKCFRSAHSLKNFRPKENGIAKKRRLRLRHNHLLNAMEARTHLNKTNTDSPQRVSVRSKAALVGQLLTTPNTF